MPSSKNSTNRSFKTSFGILVPRPMVITSMTNKIDNGRIINQSDSLWKNLDSKWTTLLGCIGSKEIKVGRNEFESNQAVPTPMATLFPICAKSGLSLRVRLKNPIVVVRLVRNIGRRLTRNDSLTASCLFIPKAMEWPMIIQIWTQSVTVKIITGDEVIRALSTISTWPSIPNAIIDAKSVTSNVATVPLIERTKTNIWSGR